MSRFSKALNRFVEIIWKHPKATLVIIAAITAVFAVRVPMVRIVSDFSDLLPQDHPYIQLHNEIRDTFGGANNIIVLCHG